MAAKRLGGRGQGGMPGVPAIRAATGRPPSCAFGPEETTYCDPGQAPRGSADPANPVTAGRPAEADSPDDRKAPLTRLPLGARIWRGRPNGARTGGQGRLGLSGLWVPNHEGRHVSTSAQQSHAEQSAGQSAEQSVDLRDPTLAAFLAWLIPGLGHLYQRRTAKAAVFFICIMGTFAYGVYLGGSAELGWGRVVYFSFREDDWRLPYLCQVGVGLAALPALIQANRMSSGKEVWLNGFMAPPRIPSARPDADEPNGDQPTSHVLHLSLHRYFELGTAYTMVAGLLNVLAVYDAWGGPVLSAEAKKEEEDEDEEKKEKDQEQDGKSPDARS